jgi:hypothetical protein
VRAKKSRKAARKMSAQQQFEAASRFRALEACVNKRVYASEEEATWAMTTVLKKGNPLEARPGRIYRCDVCSRWHLTSSVPEAVVS